MMQNKLNLIKRTFTLSLFLGLGVGDGQFNLIFTPAKAGEEINFDEGNPQSLFTYATQIAQFTNSVERAGGSEETMRLALSQSTALFQTFGDSKGEEIAKMTHPARMKLALDLFEKAAVKGHIDSAFRLGHLLLLHEDPAITRNDEKGLRYLKQAYEGGMHHLKGVINLIETEKSLAAQCKVELANKLPFQNSNEAATFYLNFYNLLPRATPAQNSPRSQPHAKRQLRFLVNEGLISPNTIDFISKKFNL